MQTLALSAAAALLATTAMAEVQTRTITFQNEGATLSGTLYLPADHDGGKLPVVVVTGAWTTVEEQMPAIYAEEMVERGFAAFTFDFRGWGKSGDLPQNVRFKEDPEAKISDLKKAFEVVATLPEVDAARISGIGICASAGYMVDAASGNPLVASIGLVAPWLQNAVIVDAVYGGAEGIAGLQALSAEAKATPGGIVIGAAGPAGTEGVLMAMDGYYADPARGAIPAYDNRWNQLGWESWLAYLPADHAPRLDKPLAIVHSEAAAIPDGVRTFLAGYAGAPVVEWLDNVDQFSFYDRADAVDAAADTVAAHFRQSAG